MTVDPGNIATRDAGANLPPLVLNTALLGTAPMGRKLELAAASGFTGVEVWLHEVAPDMLTDADAAELEARFGITADRAPLDTAGLLSGARRLGLAFDGLLPAADAMTRWSHALDDALIKRFAGMLDVAVTLGCRYLVLPTVTTTGTLGDVAGSLGELAGIARERGVRLGLEPIGHSPVMSTVAQALTVLERSGAGSEEAGIVLDAFQFFRAGQSLTDLAPLAPGQIAAVQINDAIDLPREALFGNRHRDYPGHGIFDVAGFCAAVLALGHDGPFAVEIINPALMAQPPKVTSREAFRSSAGVLQGAAASVAA